MSRSIQASESGANEGIATELPAGWSRVDEDDLPHGVREQFEHAETGLCVSLKYQQRPTQMHDPMTASTDTGYVAQVHRSDALANISHELAAKRVARDRMREFMTAYPDGEFEIPSADEQPFGDAPIDWRSD